jgi:hypothetical protein
MMCIHHKHETHENARLHDTRVDVCYFFSRRKGLHIHACTCTSQTRAAIVVAMHKPQTQEWIQNAVFLSSQAQTAKDDNDP